MPGPGFFARYGGAGAFSPPSGLVAWRSAAAGSNVLTQSAGSVVTAGNPVGYIKDLSGNGNHIYQGAWNGGTDAQRPTLLSGAGGVSLSGSQAFVDPLSLVGAKTRIIALRQTGANGTQSVMSTKGAGPLFSEVFFIDTIFEPTYEPIALVDDTLSTTTIGAKQAVGTDPHVMSLTYNGSGNTTAGNYAVRFDGVSVGTSATSGSDTRTGTDLGAIGARQPIASGFVGEWYEDLIFSRVLNSTELAYVESYLASKWGTGFGYAIVADGDSIMYGYGSATGVRKNWLEVAMLYAQRTYTRQNFAIVGQTVQTMLTNVSTKIVPVLQAHVAAGRQAILILEGGTNDLAIAAGRTAAQVESDLTSYVNTVRAAVPSNLKILRPTILPRTDAGVNGTFETARQAVSTWDRTKVGTLYDAVIDLAADPTIGVAGASSTSYYSGDLCHPSDSGYNVAGAVALPVFNAINPGTPPTPLQIFGATNLKSWVKGDAGIVLATGVSQWQDQSGNGNHFAQATGSAQPTQITSGLNGKNTVRFDGAAQYMQGAAGSSLITTSAWGMFVVAKWITITGGVWPGTFHYNTPQLVYVSGTATAGIGSSGGGVYSWAEQYDGSDQGAYVAISAGTYYRFAGWYDGAKLNHTVGNTVAAPVTSGAISLSIAGAMNLGCGYNTSYLANCEIAEVAIVNRAPTPAECAAMAAYLTARWGV